MSQNDRLQYEGYIIRRAEYDDIPHIMDFIRTDWSDTHIMSFDSEYFEFEFVIDGKVDFIMATDEAGNICGILGFLPCSRDKSRLDLFGSIWLVTKEQHLGVAMDKYMRDIMGCRYRVGIGLNRRTAVPMVRLFIGDNTAKMNQFFMINRKMENYVLIDVPDGDVWDEIPDNGYRLKKIETSEELKTLYDIRAINDRRIPYKDEWLYKRKYYDNPRRKYDVWAICDRDGHTDSFIVTRCCEAEGVRALRVVDFCGKTERISDIGYPVKALIESEGYEYADCYNYGVDPDVFIAGGFRLRSDSDGYVIPNYYEPFEKRNVDIWVRYKEEGTLIFKADGDQDRLNIPLSGGKS